MRRQARLLCWVITVAAVLPQLQTSGTRISLPGLRFFPDRSFLKTHARCLPSMRLRGGSEVDVLPEAREDPPAAEIDAATLIAQSASEHVAAAEGGGFAPLTANYGEVLQLESVCMECYGQGRTMLMPTEIPRFGRVIVTSFEV